MRFFDTHCDTVMLALDGKLDFVAGRSDGDGRAHVDLPRLEAAGSCLQLFAVFTSRKHMPDRDLHAYADQAVAAIRGWVEESGGRMRLALGASDIRAACSGGGFYGMLGLEGADCAGDKAEGLEHFIDLGVRNVIPAWADNAFSGTVFGDGGPLTAEGIRLVELCQARRVMVDVSHLSDVAFWQVRDLARRPFIASHSNCRAVCPHKRNLDDEMIRALAAKGGVMGINLSADFVSPDYMAQAEPIYRAAQPAMDAAADSEEKKRLREATALKIAQVPAPPIEWIARHVQHAIQVGGEDCIGLGGDLDGIEAMPAPMTGIESYPLIPQALEQAGLSPAQIEKVCWRNWQRVFSEVLPE
jgi:membrane dipeptidase